MEFKQIINNLQDEKLYAKENFIPIIRDKSAEYLYDFIKEHKFKKVLEIGTAIGYSGSIILSASDLTLCTVDINEKSLEIAEKTFTKLNFQNRVKVYNDDAKNFLKLLIKENQKFDMIFLDGAKGQYIYYLDDLTELLVDGGYIFADNVLLQGMVESSEKIPHRKRTMVVNLRKYLDKINKYPYQSELLRIEDGIAITKVKR
jgi:caffeoyl-CoA O-methyltransferase